MKLRVLPIAGVAGSGFVLGDNSLSRGPGEKVISEWSPTFDALVETSTAFEANEVENFDRYNESTSFSVEISYEFASEDLKAAFILALQTNVPRRATVEFTAANTIWYLIDAKLRPISKVEEYEAAITLRYNISGGLLTQNLPATSSAVPVPSV